MERAEDQVRVIMRTRRHDAPGADDGFELETNDTFLDIWKQISSLFTWVVVGHGVDFAGGRRHGHHEHHAGLASPSAPARSVCARRSAPATRCAAAIPDRERHHGHHRRRDRHSPSASCVAKLITLIIGFPTVSVSISSIVLGLFVAAATGIFFGVYPASKAAKLDPIVVALQSHEM